MFKIYKRLRNNTNLIDIGMGKFISYQKCYKNFRSIPTKLSDQKTTEISKPRETLIAPNDHTHARTHAHAHTIIIALFILVTKQHPASF